MSCKHERENCKFIGDGETCAMCFETGLGLSEYLPKDFGRVRFADLPQAGASAKRISSVVRSNATTGWIKVSERLPEINIPVLAIIPDVHYPAYAFRANNADEYMVYYTSGVKRCNTVTHWMPLPEPPEV